MNPTDKRTVAQALVSASVNGTRQSIGHLATTNPSLLALVTKLVPSQFPTARDNKGNNKITTPRMDSIAAVSQSISRKRADAKAIQEIFPDVRLAIEIYLVMVISPNDMFTEELNFAVDSNLYCKPLISGLIDIVRQHFEKDYPLLDKFYDILKEAAFGAGCHPIMVLPESSLDELIHGGPAVVEKLKNATERDRLIGGVMTPGGTVRSLGLLGPAGNSNGSDGNFRISLESYGRVSPSPLNMDVNIKLPGGISSFVAVHDNPEVIKFGRVQNMLNTRKQSELSGAIYHKTSAALEREAMNDSKLSSLLMSSGRAGSEPMLRIRSLSETARETIGECLEVILPPESVMPLIAPGNPRKRLAYFVAIDQNGYPIQADTQIDNFDKLRFSAVANNSANKDMTSFLLQKAQESFGGSCTDPTMAQAAQIFGEIIDADVLSRVRNGVLGSEVVISNAENVYRVMFARALQKRHTQLLYVPEEMLTYFAYDVNPDGTGKSLLEEARVMAALRAQMLYARVQGATKNSIGRTRATITVDAEDADRVATMELLRTEIIASRSMINSANSLIPSDIMMQLGAAGVEIDIAGEGPIPGTSVKFDEVQSNYSKPDQDLDEYLTDNLISAVGVPPEMVADAKRLEFATIAANNNLILAKRARNTQQRFEPQLTHHGRAHLRSNGNVMNKMLDYVKANLKLVKDDKNAPQQIRDADNEDLLTRLLVSEFVSNLHLELNKPNVKSRQSQLEVMNQYIEGVDMILEANMSGDSMDPALVGEEAAKRTAAYQNMIRGTLIRREMQRIGFMPEVLDIFSKDADGNLVGDISAEAADFVTNMSRGMRELLTKLAEIGKGADADLSKIKTPESTSTGVSYDGGGTGNTSSTPASDDNLGSDLSLDDVTPPAGDAPPAEGGGDGLDFEIPAS